MGLSDVANRDHERWFPHHPSAWKVTDPEFIERLDRMREASENPTIRLAEPAREVTMVHDTNRHTSFPA